MNSAELATPLSSISEQPPWSEVRRIYRRICLLRATGRNDEASAVEAAELSAALATARQASEAGSKEAEIFAEEAERVASATLLADLLAPLLAAKLQAASVSAGGEKIPAAAAALRKPESPLAPPPRRARVSVAPDSPVDAGAPAVPGVADLIEGMLSQERSENPARRSA